ncbi:glycoside hydrolase family 3 C-terminal domain-containing protein [Actinoallomurus rhizosphaericola]|uniref:glycoside hydrolase family 3 C-terminal domain-containing protein n=1 Tax=Actinoallomurus rhizosphaericola TaxID=2952536 RepID=UPI0020935BAD|nr:glycoside hydrolase family 3 C-terminal domain-containing protein [Actinoallomurus rhizosphaericola]MCO5997028.1 glycoside hydrolase family 3 C-terminal domain-containing protein [Actinoallomurus rhizosphaericola]
MRMARLAVAAAVTAALAAPLTAATGAAQAASDGGQRPWLNTSLPLERRVDLLLRQMTDQEKATLMTAVGRPSGSHATGYVPGIERLGIPGLQFSDGPSGVRDGQPETALPSPVSLAASFDPRTAAAYGTVMGTEAKYRGYQVIYGPMVNIVRTPLGGRDFETLGEDPELAGDLASAEIRAIQAQGVAAQVKHYAGNNQENARQTSSSDIDERTLHEIYLPAFEKAVADGRVWSVMCAYNKVNGVYACENAQILRDILLDTWKFDGVVGTDYPANHSTVASALAGLDQEFSGTTYFQQLPAAVAAGQVPQSVLDDAARRILRLEFRTGLFDPQKPVTANFDDDSAVARRAAEDGSVLLKNSGNTLPLDTKALRSLAVIGPNADTAITGGGGSSAVTPYKKVDPISGLKARLGDSVNVNYVKAGTTSGQPPIPASALTGLKGEYFTNKTLTGTPAVTRDDTDIDFDWGSGSPATGIPADGFSARWTGTLTAPATGAYTFSATSDDGSRVYLDDKLIADNWSDHGVRTVKSTPVQLTAGERHTLRVEYYENSGNASVSVGWSSPNLPDPQIQAAVTAAKSADAAVIVAGDSSSEGSDRTTLALPGDTDALIKAVAAANPRTVVVLRAGAPVLMPWLGKVPAVLDMWYPGQEDGNALAELLTGDAEPGGRLPVTFPKTDTQTPVAAAPGRYPAVNGVYDYSEKLDVGYRWYQDENETPLFPFGYGLSYTTFKLSHLRGGPARVTAGAGTTGRIKLTVDVTNTGRRTGSDVVQAYLGHPESAGEPPKELKAFAKVRLKAGQTRKVTLTLDSGALRTWDDKAHDWTVLDGEYPIRVGESSADTPLTTSVTVRRTLGTQYTTVTAPKITRPGDTQTVTQTFTNTGDSSVHGLALSLSAPQGWTVRRATANRSAPAVVPPGGRTDTTWKVTAPAGAAAGPATLTGNASFVLDGRQTRTGATTTLVPYADVAKAFNNVGVTADGDPSPGNLDPKGYSFSAAQLAAVGYTPGATVTADGLTYTWPDVQPGQPDDVAAAGQVIQVHGTGGRLGLLGTGTGSSHSGTVTVTYTDGSSADLPVTFPDWYGNAAGGNSRLAVTTADWNRPPSDTLGHHKVSLYTTGGALDPSKTVETVSLPDDNGIHVFAITVG